MTSRKWKSVCVGVLCAIIMVPLATNAADPTPFDEVRAMMIAFMKKAQETRAFLREKDYVTENRSAWEAAEKAHMEAFINRGAGLSVAEQDRIREAYYGTNNTYYESEGVFTGRYNIDFETTAQELLENPEYARELAEGGVRIVSEFMSGEGRAIEDIWINIDDRLKQLEKDERGGNMTRRDFMQLLAIRSQVGNIRRMVPAMIGEVLPNGLDIGRILEVRAGEEAAKMAVKALGVAKEREVLMSQFRPGQSFGLRPIEPGDSVNPLRPNLADTPSPLRPLPDPESALGFMRPIPDTYRAPTPNPESLLAPAYPVVRPPAPTPRPTPRISPPRPRPRLPK